MAFTGEFSKDIVAELGKRAAYHCSNPDCGVLTSGPTSSETGTVIIGEAAHIYGRTERSARYNAKLTLNELADITNGLWLCCNCHREIDKDQIRFTAELLFEWRRTHEHHIREKIGKKGDLIREKYRPHAAKINL